MSTYLYSIVCCGIRWVDIYSDRESQCPACKSTFTTKQEG